MCSVNRAGEGFVPETSICCTGAASLGACFTARYFSSAYPIVSLDLRMNREEALARARDISGRQQFPPGSYREVASFSGDQFTQNFIELEGGGTSVLRAVIASGIHHPFMWTVRHFKPGETRETRISFTPQGLPWGFDVKLPENEKGPALNADQARKIAEDAAVSGWQVDIGPYQLVEKSRDVRPGGRVDHTFTYERSDAHIGEGSYRLALVVSGDKLTALRRFIKVPEAFSRRYKQMRSANDLISMIDSVSLILLYFLGGCGIGLFFLLRKHSVLWRKPLFWGVLIALLQLLAGLNDWPLSWMNYDTAVSAESFTALRIAQLVLLFAVYAVVFTISFMAAESLSRRAFPHHLQQWKLWSRGIANSKPVLGRTVGGYLLVGVFFAYDVFLYLATSKTLGWWTPSDALVQPDILSAHFPWFSPIAVSAQAGFWEESLFRAVPLAGAALLGDRFGKRKWWIAGAMVVQALIFGGGHAAYLNQPAYARVVELIIPSLAFGGLYLCFGLLPAIVLHFTFDVVWLSLPLFVSTAPGIWLDRILVILATLIPLWIVLGSRLKAKAWSDVPEAFLNRAQVPIKAEKTAVIETPVQPQSENARTLRRSLPALGLLGLLAWMFASHYRTDAPPLTISRGQATVLARRTLGEHGVRLPPPWRELAALESQPGPAHRFIWQSAGKEAYQGLMGQYLPPPQWRIRFVRFEGDVAERAEEYQVFVDGLQGAYRFRHVLAEDTPGKSLAENDARLLAHETLKQQFQVDPSLLKEVSADSSKLKTRTDWVFTFSEERGVRIAPGEKRIAVQIAGDQVADAYQFVYTPEEWNRRDRDRQVLPSIINLSSIAVLALVALAGAVAAIVAWSRKSSSFPHSCLLRRRSSRSGRRSREFDPDVEAQFRQHNLSPCRCSSSSSRELLGALVWRESQDCSWRLRPLELANRHGAGGDLQGDCIVRTGARFQGFRIAGGTERARGRIDRLHGGRDGGACCRIHPVVVAIVGGLCAASDPDSGAAGGSRPSRALPGSNGHSAAHPRLAGLLHSASDKKEAALRGVAGAARVRRCRLGNGRDGQRLAAGRARCRGIAAHLLLARAAAFAARGGLCARRFRGLPRPQVRFRPRLALFTHGSDRGRSARRGHVPVPDRHLR
jgi:hypothetical protein